MPIAAQQGSDWWEVSRSVVVWTDLKAAQAGVDVATLVPDTSLIWTMVERLAALDRGYSSDHQYLRP